MSDGLCLNKLLFIYICILCWLGGVHCSLFTVQVRTPCKHNIAYGKTKNKGSPPTKTYTYVKQTNKNEICIVNANATSVLGLFTLSIKMAAVGLNTFSFIFGPFVSFVWGVEAAGCPCPFECEFLFYCVPCLFACEYIPKTVKKCN